MLVFNSFCKKLRSVRFNQYFPIKTKLKMSKEVYIRSIEHSEKFEVTFKFDHGQVHREYNFKRSLSEKMDDFVNRIRTNVEKVVNSKKKKKKEPESKTEVPIEISFVQNGSPIQGSLNCKEVIFENNNDIILNLLGECYKVVVNPPWVGSLSLPQSLMVGSYCYPRKLEICFGAPLNSVFEWYKCERSSSKWTQINSSSKLLYITDELLNHKLKLRCLPGDGKVFGPAVEVETNAVIKGGPEKCYFMKSHELTKEILPEGRVVSYNILAEAYSETVTAKRELFAYCPPFALNGDYRKQLYIRELIGYNADILCLQEVDQRIFNNDLNPVLKEKGYQGILTIKSGTVLEGVATFFNNKKFRLHDVKELSFSESIDTNPIFTDIWDKIKSNEAVVKNLKERTTVLHALILENRDNFIVVGNTHLFFFPSADHIRVLQGAMASKFLEHVVKNLQETGKNTSLIFCGDMNSTPDCGLYSLMTKKIALADMKDWHSDPNEVVIGFDITQPFEIKSAYGTPKYTNYTVGFQGCLDYIYYQSDVLKLLQTVPIPPEEVVSEHKALPSPQFPSDHVALVADFEWIVKT